MPNLITVSNRLPVTVGEKITKSSGGLVAAMEAVTHGDGELKWIGWPGAAVEEGRQEEVARTLEKDYNFTPVFFSDQEIEAFYEGFANASLWPLLHYMPSRFRYQPEWWPAYESANRRFAEKVLEHVEPGDLVWVHDYQLMLVPAMLKEKMPELRIGFFLHTPFPSYEIFRCHPRRNELVSGMLGADLIGFHTFGYMRHFRSAALRLLGIESEMTRIRQGGHVTSIGVYPIGINSQKFEKQIATPEHGKHLAGLAKENEGMQLVLSVERLDYTKGLLNRLDAIELFLKDESRREKVKFLFVSVPSREGVKEYQELIQEVEQRIGQLNGKYATVHNTPIHFIHGSVEFPELCALYSLADVAMVTPVIDGMNLVAKEYIACQKEDPGVLILSEFTGAAEELFNAIIVNPYDAQSVATAIVQALGMDRTEREHRMVTMRRRVMRFDAQWWARKFIEELAAVETHGDDHDMIVEARKKLADAIQNRRRIALFLDYDGTLREIEREPDQARPNKGVTELLKRLSEQAAIDVTLISGRTTHDLEKWFGDYPFGLVAEHGASVRPPGEKQWQKMDEGISYAWKNEIPKMLHQFEAQTPGSFVEEKRTSLVWHYRKSDPEFGEYKARQLSSELALLAANEPVVVRHGDKIVEIGAASINKGAALQKIVAGKQYDLILCAGDDQTDESMFRLEMDGLITIKVGDGDTAAKARIVSPARFREFLLNLLPRSA